MPMTLHANALHIFFNVFFQCGSQGLQHCPKGRQVAQWHQSGTVAPVWPSPATAGNPNVGGGSIMAARLEILLVKPLLTSGLPRVWGEQAADWLWHGEVWSSVQTWWGWAC